MASVSSSIALDANLLNLKEISPSQIRPEVNDFMVDGETIIQCFMTVRDQVIFTNKRVFVVNVQGITGKRYLISLTHTQNSLLMELKRQDFWI